MSNFKGIVYLTEEQYLTLKQNGTITVDDITINFDESTLYVTDDTFKHGNLVFNYAESDVTINEDGTLDYNSAFKGTQTFDGEHSIGTMTLVQQKQLNSLVTAHNNLVNNKADKDLSNVTYPTNTAGVVRTGAGDRVTRTYISSDKNIWYRIWASGWKECGGTVQERSSGNYTLPTEFSNTNYTVITSANKSGDNYYFVRAYAATVNTINVLFKSRSGGDASAPFMFYCCGY